MNDITSVDFYIDELYPEPGAIELLGYAKNDIVQVKRIAFPLPEDQLIKLSVAYALLQDVQEHIFHDPLVA